MLILLLVLTAVYVFYFTDWFKPKIISISSTSRVFGRRPANSAGYGTVTIPVTFSLDPQCRPTDIKVVPLAAWQTNPSTPPVWHLVYNSNAAPVKIFFYGQRLRGLKPEIPGVQAEPLQPNVTYRMFLAAGRAKGQHDFEIKTAN